MERRQRNNGRTMTTFYSRQSDGGERLRKNASANRSNFAPRIPPANLHRPVHEARKIRCNKVQDTVQAYAAGLIFYAEQALPLVWTRFFRLAKSSPKLARSPARRSRDGRETSGKKSGEMSRVISAQRPGNGRTVANAMLPNIRQDGSQDNLPCAGLVPQCPRRKLARQLAICPRNSRAAVRVTANATSRKRLVGIPTAAFNHDIQKL